LEVFLCCSPGDREVAATIASRLEQGAEVTVAVDDGETESVAAKWESGLSSAAILLLLSPEAVPGPLLNRADWGTLLDHVSKYADPPIGSLLVRGCNYPKSWNADASSGGTKAIRGRPSARSGSGRCGFTCFLSSDPSRPRGCPGSKAGNRSSSCCGKRWWIRQGPPSS
jgi:hypothetical protein